MHARLKSSALPTDRAPTTVGEMLFEEYLTDRDWSPGEFAAQIDVDPSVIEEFIERSAFRTTLRIASFTSSAHPWTINSASSMTRTATTNARRSELLSTKKDARPKPERPWYGTEQNS
jgi:plasmid maintenance system antidote protein VapI